MTNPNITINDTYSLLHILTTTSDTSNGNFQKIKDILKSKLLSQPLNTKQSTQSTNDSSFISFDDRTLLDHHGNSPLYWACLFGQNETVNLLVKSFQMPVNRQNDDGDTPLAVGVKSGSFDVVCTLLDHGANPNISNVRAETPLHVASCFGYSDICKELIKFGSWIDAEDDCGDTPLHWAVREEQIEIVEILLNLGADPHHMNEDDESPLNLAESVGSNDLINVFDSIACEVESEVDGVAYGFSIVSSNNDHKSKGIPKTDTSNSMDVDNWNSDDYLNGGTVELEVINTSGTVYPSSLSKEDEYEFLAGKDKTSGKGIEGKGVTGTGVTYNQIIGCK